MRDPDKLARQVAIEHAQSFMAQHCSYMSADRQLMIYDVTKHTILDALGDFNRRNRSKVGFSVN